MWSLDKNYEKNILSLLLSLLEKLTHSLERRQFSHLNRPREVRANVKKATDTNVLFLATNVQSSNLRHAHCFA